MRRKIQKQFTFNTSDAGLISRLEWLKNLRPMGFSSWMREAVEVLWDATGAEEDYQYDQKKRKAAQRR